MTGTDPVKLQVSDGRSTDETTQSVYVKAVVTEPAPVANFIISPSKPVAGAIVLFGDRSTNNPTKWRWDFGDRTGAETTPTTSHTFATAGTFAVTLTATNAVGSDTKTVNVEVSPSPKAPPVASFAVRPAPVDRLAGKPLTFEDTTPGAVTAPLWIFPDGDQAPTDGSRRVIHTFPTPGPVTVSMRVCWADDRANCTTMSETIVILRALSLPVPSFVMSGPGVINQQSAAAGIPITFTDTSTGEQLQSWKWVIGNQARSGREVKATIDAGGEVAVLLTVGNPAGEKPVARVIRIVATNPPVAAFGLPPSPVLAGTSVSFVDRSTGSPTAWRWDFGDSTATSSEQNPAHVYATAGTYAVSLVATNASGTSQANATVGVSATPAPTATTAAPAAAPRIQAIGLSLENPGSGSAALVAPRGVEVRFFDVSNVASTLTAGTTWVWDFGDASAPATGATTSHVYTVAGRYTVKVTVTTRTGGVGSDQLPIKVV